MYLPAMRDERGPDGAQLVVRTKLAAGAVGWKCDA